MKTKMILLVFALSSFIWFTSCEKDEETAKPLINNFELGYLNSKKVTQGNDLHINAEIIAEGKIKNIQVTIHPEGEHDGMKSISLLMIEEEWEFDSIYIAGFEGVKNTSFHKHIDIPVTAETGTYHFHFIVTDMEGNQTEIEDDLIIETPTDSQASVITVTAVPAVNQLFSNRKPLLLAENVLFQVITPLL